MLKTPSNRHNNNNNKIFEIIDFHQFISNFARPVTLMNYIETKALQNAVHEGPQNQIFFFAFVQFKQTTNQPCSNWPMWKEIMYFQIPIL